MRLTLLAIAAAITLTACDRPAKHVARERQPARTHIETSIELPGSQGVVAHVLVVPTGYLESTRCVVVTGGAGIPSVACTPKDIDIPPPDE